MFYEIFQNKDFDKYVYFLERGIIMSVYAYPEDQKLKHLEKFPGYEDVSHVRADGIKFENKELWFDGIDNDYATKTVYMYEENFKCV